jgi:carboxymethylenebutenolidase
MTKTIEHFKSGGGSVPLEILMPSAGAVRCAAVLLLHGSDGLQPPYGADIASFADALAARGIATAIPHYLEATGTPPGAGVFAEIERLRPTWRQVCSDALAVLAVDPRFDPAHLGLLGFSLGANLALSLAMDPPSAAQPRCVVDFFGPTQGLESRWATLPPVLIVHGCDDTLVPPGESQRLVARLEAAGKRKGRDYRFSLYEGQGHGFHGAALATSREEAVGFLAQTL